MNQTKPKTVEFKKGQIVYIQGVWKGIVQEDADNYVPVKPLEGLLLSDEGKTFHYQPFLLKSKKYGMEKRFRR